MRRWVIALLLVLAAGSTMSGEVTMAAAEDAVWSTTECPSDADRPQRGGLPADFRVVWVLRCREETRDIAGRGRWSVTVRERADTSAEQLLVELRKPDESPGWGMGCGPGFPVVPYFALVGHDGRVLVPSTPRDTCSGGTLPGLLPALEALPYRVLSERLDRQVFSEAVKFGCQDEASFAATKAKPGKNRTVWLRPARLRVCLYQVTPEGRGVFVSGREVGRADDDRLADAIEDAGPAAPCVAPHTRFAVVNSAQDRDRVMVELDGCRRVLSEDDTLLQLDEAGVAMIG